ncbi:MAG: AMP-binding protein, partial [Acidobacteria bacterium]|nr:AMP-binding protein [Acidobacteriota bacterium]
MQLIQGARAFADRIAVVDAAGEWSYGDLLAASGRRAGDLLGGRPDLEEERIAFLVPPGFDYVACLWGVWRAGGIAVPLCLSHPPPELGHVLVDAGVRRVLAAADHAEKLFPLVGELGGELEVLAPATRADPLAEEPANALPSIGEARRATILYTSGTTGKPKGVVATHGNLAAQIASLVESWHWTSEDHILNVLPLHHVHGIVNVLLSALASGACWETLPRFDAEEVWRRFETRPLTLFMAVPTVYHRLIQAFDAQPPERQADLSEAASRLRLMVSGSAALPVPVLERWREITGHVLLERYGMTEIGMALSN